MPETKTKKKTVRFGVEKAYYAPLNDDGTYGTPKPLLGAVSLTMTPSGESNNFYADNELFAVFNTNSGYTGSIELAYLDEEARVDLLGDVVDAVGGTIEDAEAQPNRVALMWQTNSNVANKRVVFYDVTFNRPEENANTTKESTDPDTTTVEYTAAPREVEYNGKTIKTPKYSMPSDTELGKTVYDKWFENVPMPKAEAA